MSDIGCKDEDIFVNDFNVVKPTPGSIGVGIASKELKGGDKLVVIGVRGMGYESEWVSNMTLGTSGEAKGWSAAAGHIISELRDYLERKGIDGKSEKTKFWISGYSRAGATANLIAKRIVDNYDNNGTHTFAYPMEAPKGGIESEKVSGNNYSCIHNIVNQNDIVTWVGTSQMGFIRYGADHYVPGSVTTQAVNSPWNVTKNTDREMDYSKQRELVKKHLEAVNSGIIFDDYYHRATMQYLGSAFGADMNDSSGEYGKYLPENKVTVNVVDINMNAVVDTYEFYTENVSFDSMTVPAPALENMEFIGWNDETVTGSEITIQMGSFASALYQPIVRKLDVIFSDDLIAGKEMPALEELDVTISNKYRIDDNVTLEWIRPDSIAKPGTFYTACICLDTNDFMATNLSVPDSQSELFSGKFTVPDDIEVNAETADGDAMKVTAVSIRHENSAAYLNISFAKTNKEKIADYTEVTATVEHNSTQDEILAALPDTVYAYLADGRMIKIPAKWNRTDAPDTTISDVQIVTAYGILNTGDYDTTEITLTAAVTVLAADKADAPAASPVTGSYTGAQKIELSA